MRAAVWLTMLWLLAAVGSPVGRANAKEGAEKRVSIKDLKYQPESISIEPGDTVVWKNDDDGDRTVTADDNSFDSGVLSSGQSFKHTFEKKGKFRYHCKYHPRMKGTILVGKDKD